jgi:hypothetical protein
MVMRLPSSYGTRFTFTTPKEYKNFAKFVEGTIADERAKAESEIYKLL